MQPGSLLSISGSAELTDTYRRGGIPAPLALQRNVPEECIAVRALPPDQQRPRHVSDTSARWARRSQMGVALSLRFRDRLGPPAGIEFHGPQHGNRDVRQQGQRRSQKKRNYPRGARRLLRRARPLAEVADLA